MVSTNLCDSPEVALPLCAPVSAEKNGTAGLTALLRRQAYSARPWLMSGNLHFWKVSSSLNCKSGSPCLSCLHKQKYSLCWHLLPSGSRKFWFVPGRVCLLNPNFKKTLSTEYLRSSAGGHHFTCVVTLIAGIKCVLCHSATEKNTHSMALQTHEPLTSGVVYKFHLSSNLHLSFPPSDFSK